MFYLKNFDKIAKIFLSARVNVVAKRVMPDYKIPINESKDEFGVFLKVDIL